MKELTPIVQALAGFVSVVYSLAKGNLLAIFNLAAPALTLKSVDWSKVKGDLLALTDADRATLEAQFDAAVSVSDPAAAKTIGEIAGGLNQLVTVAEEAFKVYTDGVALIAKLKSTLGV